MKAPERRRAILDILEASDKPVTATQLAKQFQVSRQIIVGDIALLRAADHQILATNRGYLAQGSQASSKHPYQGRIVCYHEAKQMEEELEIILNLGGQVESVEVDHPVYGLITAPLQLRSQDDLHLFIRQMEAYQGILLSSLTEGIHSHTISCQDSESFLAIKEALKEANILLADS
ncbi:3H domain-containing protein [Hutsoniella sourekii]